jgi:TetR/AcrR family transcriptional regulator
VAEPDEIPTRQPRRAPSPDERQRDAERSRERLLTAALDEFAAHGYAGARVGSIASRAGLNAQLISYYFGGKAGLYRALQQRWLDREATLNEPPTSLADLVAEYARVSLDEPQMARLLLWAGLNDGDETEPAGQPPAGPEGSLDNGLEDLAEMERRRAAGEIAPGLDPALIQLAMMGATLAPVALPQVARRLGLDPDAPDFAGRYVELVREIVRRLHA